MFRKIALFVLCFSAGSVVANTDTQAISERLDRLERDVTLVQQKIYGGKTATGDTRKARRSLQENKTGSDLSEVYSLIDEQSLLIADLTGKVEELTKANEVLTERLEIINEDVNMRFQKLEHPEPVAEPKTKPTDKEAYEKAYSFLTAADYEAAEKAFRQFMVDYPESSLAGNANYWLGETFYVRGQYEVAVGIFSDGVTKYADSIKAPDNMLKVGLTMAQLKKTEEACGFLKLLPEQFPKAETALKNRAEEEVRRLACP